MLICVNLISDCHSQNEKAALDEIQLYTDSGNVEYQSGDLEKAFRFWEYGLQLAKRNENFGKIAHHFILVGAIHRKKHDYSLALQYFDSAKMVLDEHINLNMLDKYYNNLGILYEEIGSWEEAIVNFQNSYNTKIQLPNPSNLDAPILNLGTIHMRLNNLGKAEDLFSEALKYSKIDSDSNAIFMAYVNLSVVERENENYRNGLQYLDSAKIIIQALENTPAMMILNANYGDTYYELEEFEKAIEKYSESNKIAYQYESWNDQLYNLARISQSFIELNKYQLAVDSAEKAMPLTFLNVQKEYRAMIFKTAAKANAEVGMFENAYSFIEIAEELEAEILDESKQKRIIAEDARFEFERNKNKLKQAQIDQLENSITIAQKNKQIQILVISLLALTAGYVILRQLKKKNDALALKTKLEDVKKNERRRISQTLHNRLQPESYEISERLKATNVGFKEKQLIIDKTQQLTQQIRAISHDVEYFVDETSNVSDVIFEFCESMNVGENIEIKNDIQSSTAIENWDVTKKQETIALAKNAIMNAILHSKASMISVILKTKGNFTLLEIADNGIGFDHENVVSGIGLRSIKQIASELKGSLNIDSNLGEGTSVNVVFENYG